MTLNKILARFVTIAFLVSSVQIGSFAASVGRVDKVLTVGESEVLAGDEAPVLIINLKDPLSKGDLFYLDLDGAVWQDDVYAQIVGDTDAHLKLTKISDTEMQVEVADADVSAVCTLEITLATKLTGPSAKVSIDGNNTGVMDESFQYATVAAYTGSVKASDVQTVTSSGEMAKLTINEPFSGAFAKSAQKGNSSVVTLRLNTNAYAFDLTDKTWSLKGIKGFAGLEGEKIRQVDAQTLEITLPDTSEYKNKGSFELTGIKLVPEDQAEAINQVTVTVSGDLVEKTTLNVLNVSDYDITLTADDKHVRAGSKQKACFTLKEVVAHSLIKERPTSVYLTNGAYLEADDNGQVSVLLNGERKHYKGIVKDDKVIGFEVPELNDQADTYQFEVETILPAQTSGEVGVKLSGRSLIKDLDTVLFEVNQPFKISVSPFDVVVGIKDQVGGSIEITELSAGNMAQDESIVINLEKGDVSLTDLPKIEVVSGDLRLGKATYTANSIVIPVTRSSNEASTVRLSDFKVTSGQNTAYGDYEVTIGGSALSNLEKEGIADNVSSMPFIKVVANKGDTVVTSTETGKNKEVDGASVEEATDVTDTKNEAEKKASVVDEAPSFKLTSGQTTYEADGETHQLKVAPYMKDGTLMAPTEAVLALLDLDETDFTWEADTKTVTIHSDPPLVLTLGEQAMQVGSETIDLSVAPELKDGKTYIPIGEICDALDLNYTFQDDQLTVYK